MDNLHTRQPTANLGSGSKGEVLSYTREGVGEGYAQRKSVAGGQAAEERGG